MQHHDGAQSTFIALATSLSAQVLTFMAYAMPQYFYTAECDHLHEPSMCFAGKKCTAFFHEESGCVFAPGRKVS